VRCISRSDDGNGQCDRNAEPASLLCSSHGGRLPDERRASAERVELAKLTVLNTLVQVVEEAASVYIGIMRDPTEKATDRIKAADRVMEMAGLRNGQPLVQVQINTGLRPQEDARDARLVAIIEKHNAERAELLKTKVIEATAREAG
jgi:hypothetical protein